MGRSRGGLTSKIHALVDTNGLPVRLALTAGKAHDNRLAGKLERFFNKIKHSRRVATRYDKLATNYLAFVQLASIRAWLRVNESASQTAGLRSNIRSAKSLLKRLRTHTHGLL